MMKTQMRGNALNFKIFSDVFSEVNFEIAKKDVERADCSVPEMKYLTSGIMDAVSESHNIELMNCIAQKVEDWCSDITVTWKKSLLEYARTQDDIESLYCGNGERAHEFVLVTTSTDSDLILQHNDFCFELFDSFDDITEFMVLHKDEFASMQEYFGKFSKIF